MQLVLKNKTLVIHWLMAFFIISIPVLSSPDLKDGTKLFSNFHFLRNFSSYVLMAGFFFLHYYVLFPKYYRKEKLWLYILLIIASCFLVFFLPDIVSSTLGRSGHMGPPPNTVGNSQENYIFRIISFNNGIIFQFIAIWLLSLFLKFNERLIIANNEKLTAEVNYLKAKINPHFLFNTLNNIYSLALTKSSKAPETILKLSDLMRYIVTESENERVALTKELTHIENFVGLQKLRISSNTTLNFKITGEPKNLLIAPIILINYIENAFKFGVNPDLQSKISIDITIDEGYIILLVENNIVVNTQETKIYSTEEGMYNTLKRLKIVYPNKYKLDINNNGETYSCLLKIDLR